MYSTWPLISHLGNAFLPSRNVLLMLFDFGGSSKFPFGKRPAKTRSTMALVVFISVMLASTVICETVTYLQQELEDEQQEEQKCT